MWPDEHSADLAALTPVPLPPALASEEERLGLMGSPGKNSSSSGGGGGSAGTSPRPRFLSVMRDVPYSYETLAENLMDPAHLPFSHLGVGTLQREQGGVVSEASVAEEVGACVRGCVWVLTRATP